VGAQASLRAPFAPDPGGRRAGNKPKLADLCPLRARTLATPAAAVAASLDGPGAPATLSQTRAAGCGAARAAGRRGQRLQPSSRPGPSGGAPTCPAPSASPIARTPPPGARHRAGAFCVTAEAKAPKGVGAGGWALLPRHRPSPAAPPPPAPLPAACPARPCVRPQSSPVPWDEGLLLSFSLPPSVRPAPGRRSSPARE
jgi:hypothetical protein